jgi:hypothetical protein
LRRFFVLPLLFGAGVAALGGCPSAPRFRASLLVRVDGEGEAAWENPKAAATAVTLRQNLTRLIREVRRDRLKMLESEDPAAVLQEAIAAKRSGKGRVQVRIYGDSRWELRRICRALLNLWESEGLTGAMPSSGLTGARSSVAAPIEQSKELAMARARAEVEEEERRLYQTRQKVLSDRAELGHRYQQAESAVQDRQRALSAARKEVSSLDVELRRVQSILRKPVPERFRVLGDADVMRLYTEVVETESAMAKEGLAPEVKSQLQITLTRKKQSLDIAQGRFEKEAEAKLAEARDRVAAAEKALDGAVRSRDEVRRNESLLSARLKKSDDEMAWIRAKLRGLREGAGTQEVGRANPDVKVYRIRRVLRPCRVRRLED